WAPIMGVGYDRPVTQWSRGEYGGADRLEDDVAVIAAHGAPVRSDDHGDGPATATPVPSSGIRRAAGVIAERGDRDVFAFVAACPGPASLAVASAPRRPNPDVRLRLVDASGAALHSADPPVTTVNWDRASGLDARLDVQLAAGTHHVEVDGVGALDPALT